MTTRFPGFDGLRAIAALSVLVYHTAFLSHADQNDTYGPLLAHLNIGVPIFFVISGFLLYRPWVAARMEGRKGPSIAGFARRRFLRIVPAYWVALTILGIVVGLRGLFGDAPIYYLFLQEYQRDTVLNGIPPAWTLGTELAFYALLPLYAIVAAKLASSANKRVAVGRELALLGVLAAASIACRTIAQGGAIGGPVLTLGLPGTFDWFAVGMALAVLSAAGIGERIGDHAVAAWAAAVVLYVFLCYGLGLPEGYVFLQRYTYGEAFAEHVLSALIAGLIAIPAVFAWEKKGAVRQTLALPVVTWLGLVSYGIYLWHFNLIEELHEAGIESFVPLTLVTIPVVVAVAALSYYAIERPALSFRDGFRSRRGRGGGPRSDAAPATQSDQVAP